MKKADRRRAWHRDRSAARKVNVRPACPPSTQPGVILRRRIIAYLRRLPTDTARRHYLNGILAVFSITPL